MAAPVAEFGEFGGDELGGGERPVAACGISFRHLVPMVFPGRPSGWRKGLTILGRISITAVSLLKRCRAVWVF